jgi:hypothetical protein
LLAFQFTSTAKIATARIKNKGHAERAILFCFLVVARPLLFIRLPLLVAQLVNMALCVYWPIALQAGKA